MSKKTEKEKPSRIVNVRFKHELLTRIEATKDTETLSAFIKSAVIQRLKELERNQK